MDLLINKILQDKAPLVTNAKTSWFKKSTPRAPKKIIKSTAYTLLKIPTRDAIIQLNTKTI